MRRAFAECTPTCSLAGVMSYPCTGEGDVVMEDAQQNKQMESKVSVGDKARSCTTLPIPALVSNLPAVACMRPASALSLQAASHVFISPALSACTGCMLALVSVPQSRSTWRDEVARTGNVMIR